LAQKIGDADEQEKFRAIASLLNLKDDLLQQIFYGFVYRKMLLWKDLNIEGSGSKEEFIWVSGSKCE
jgi:hypothetical protein